MGKKHAPGCNCCGSSPDCPVCCRYRAPFLGGWTSGDPRTFEFTVTISGAGENVAAVPGPGYEWVPWPQLDGTYTLVWNPIAEGGWAPYQWNVTIGNITVGLRMWCDSAETGVTADFPQLAITEVIDEVQTAGLNFTNLADDTWSGYNPGAFGPYGEAAVTLSSSDSPPAGCCCLGNLCMPAIDELEGSTLHVEASGLIDSSSFLAPYVDGSYDVPIDVIFTGGDDPCEWVARWTIPEELVATGVVQPGFEDCDPLDIRRTVTVDLNVPMALLQVGISITATRATIIPGTCPAGTGANGAAICDSPGWQPITLPGGGLQYPEVTITAA